MVDKHSHRSEQDQSTYKFLKCVFPNKVTQEDVYLLIHVLDDIDDMSTASG